MAPAAHFTYLVNYTEKKKIIFVLTGLTTTNACEELLFPATQETSLTPQYPLAAEVLVDHQVPLQLGWPGGICSAAELPPLSVERNAEKSHIMWSLHTW